MAQEVIEVRAQNLHDFVRATWTPGPKATVEVFFKEPISGFEGSQTFPPAANFAASLQFSGQGAINGIRLTGSSGAASVLFGDYA